MRVWCTCHLVYNKICLYLLLQFKNPLVSAIKCKRYTSESESEGIEIVQRLTQLDPIYKALLIQLRVLLNL